MLEKFHEHIVHVPNQLGGESLLTRDDLIQGLCEMARNPVLFVEGMDSVNLVEERQDEDGTLHLTREVRFGEFTVKDHIHVSPAGEFIQDVPSQGELNASRMTARLEEPEEGALFMRFVYEVPAATNPAKDPSAAMYLDTLRQAYTDKDLAMVEKLMTFALDK